MATTITAERPDTVDAMAMISELETHLAKHYPQESRHGYSVDKLLAQGVAFFVIRNHGAAVGCGGIQLVGTEYGELKRMFVKPESRGLGYARLLLEHLENHARSHGIALVRLETGIHQSAAIKLYERAGYHRIPPFADYREDPLSRCYEKRLS
jgi:GNAT superfamily N-acetyltransferase